MSDVGFLVESLPLGLHTDIQLRMAEHAGDRVTMTVVDYNDVTIVDLYEGDIVTFITVLQSVLRVIRGNKLP